MSARLEHNLQTSGNSPFTRLRYPLVALSLTAILAGIWAGWVRIGWRWPVWQPGLILSHGPLMVSAFLGSLIALERAVALNRPWMYAGPLLTGLGGLALIFGLGLQPSAAMILLGGLVFIAMMVVIVLRHLALYTVVMLIGVIAWEIGNLLWMMGWPIYHLVAWWVSFLVLTITSERLEMGRIIRLPRSAEVLFIAACAVLLLGDSLAMVAFDSGARLAGLGMLGLSAWLLRYDIARKTIHQTGLPRFAAACLLSGYVWLGASALIGLWKGGLFAGWYYDAYLHTVLIGFVISMIFGHAPIIFPSVLRLPITYHPIFYFHLALLHASLVLRITGDLLTNLTIRMWGGLLNGIAILLFLAITAFVIINAAKQPKAEAIS